MKFQAQISQWEGQPMKHNVKVLLCTLQNVLWQGHGWKIISMSEMMNPQQVVKAYKKFIVKFHPDKF